MLEIPLVTIRTRNSASAFFIYVFCLVLTKTTTISLNIIKGFMFALCFLRGGTGLFQCFKINLRCTVVDERTGFYCRRRKWGMEDFTNTLSRLYLGQSRAVFQ